MPISDILLDFLVQLQLDVLDVPFTLRTTALLTECVWPMASVSCPQVYASFRKHCQAPEQMTLPNAMRLCIARYNLVK